MCARRSECACGRQEARGKRQEVSSKEEVSGKRPRCDFINQSRSSGKKQLCLARFGHDIAGSAWYSAQTTSSHHSPNSACPFTSSLIILAWSVTGIESPVLSAHARQKLVHFIVPTLVATCTLYKPGTPSTESHLAHVYIRFHQPATKSPIPDQNLLLE